MKKRVFKRFLFIFFNVYYICGQHSLQRAVFSKSPHCSWLEWCALSHPTHNW